MLEDADEFPCWERWYIIDVGVIVVVQRSYREMCLVMLLPPWLMFVASWCLLLLTWRRTGGAKTNSWGKGLFVTFVIQDPLNFFAHMFAFKFSIVIYVWFQILFCYLFPWNTWITYLRNISLTPGEDRGKGIREGLSITALDVYSLIFAIVSVCLVNE